MSKLQNSKLLRFVTRFCRATQGVTAVEFALVSLPLLTLIMGTLEMAMIILVVTTLENATESAGRLIRTGEFQTSAGTSRADFKALVCSRMSWLSAQCASDLTVTVQVFNDFGTLAGNAPMNGGNFVANGGCFSPGQPADIVLVRGYFNWALFTPLLSPMLDNMGNGHRLITTATAFRNEPYSATPAGGAAC